MASVGGIVSAQRFAASPTRTFFVAWRTMVLLHNGVGSFGVLADAERAARGESEDGRVRVCGAPALCRCCELGLFA